MAFVILCMDSLYIKMVFTVFRFIYTKINFCVFLTYFQLFLIWSTHPSFYEEDEEKVEEKQTQKVNKITNWFNRDNNHGII